MELKSISLKLAEFLIINVEINGTKDEQGNKIKKGIIDENISFSGRYWLNELESLIKDEVTSIEAIRNELIKKYGEVVNEQIIIRNEIQDSNGNNVMNPNFIEFMNEWQKLIETDKTINYYPLPLSGFSKVESDTETSVEYKLIFRFIEK